MGLSRAAARKTWDKQTDFRERYTDKTEVLSDRMYDASEAAGALRRDYFMEKTPAAAQKKIDAFKAKEKKLETEVKARRVVHAAMRAEITHCVDRWDPQ